MVLMPERHIVLAKFKRIWNESFVGDIIDNAFLINNVVNKLADQTKNEVEIGSWCTLIIEGTLFTKDECISILDGKIKERKKYA
jgi:hypothetical protein